MDNNQVDISKEKTNSKGKNNKVLIIVLVLISLGLASYIVYDKVIDGKEVKNNDEIVDSKTEEDADKVEELSLTSSLVTSLYDETKTDCNLFRSFYYNDDITLRTDIESDLNPEVSGIGCPIGGTYQTKIISAKKYSDRIEISEKHIYAAIDNNQSGTSYVIFGELPDYNDKDYATKIIDTVSEKNYTTSLIDNYTNKVSTYVFTFNKEEDDSYKLYSIKKES